MLLLDKHIFFENKCGEMFVGKAIQGIVYGEIKFESEDVENDEPGYSTKYSDIDSLDYSIYFKTDFGTIYVFWDNTFFSYGLSSKEINFDKTVNDYEQKWDVSNTEKWINILGKRIYDFSICWEGFLDSDIVYPQTFILKLEDETKIILSASQFKDTNQNQVFGMSDNILVTTNWELARELDII